MRDEINNFDMQKNDFEELKVIIVSYAKKLFSAKPYYASENTNKNCNDKFNKMNNLANKLVAQHMLKEMVKSNRKNPQNGYKVKDDDYSKLFLTTPTFEDHYYQNFWDKIFYFIKNFVNEFKTLASVYTTVFVTMYNTTKNQEE